MIPELGEMAYEERLKRLKPPTLSYRRLRGNMIETYKIITGVYDKNVTTGLFKTTTPETNNMSSSRSGLELMSGNVRKHSFFLHVTDS